MSRRHTVLGGVLLLGALFGAACGSDDTEEGATTTTAGSATAGSGASSTTSAGATTGKQPATWAEWEQDGAQRRAAVVKRIKDNHWGLSADGKTLTGPEGFTVNTGNCPAGWSNTEGLTDTNIKLGHTLAYSGTLAEYGNIGRGMENYMNYVNDTQGGIKDSTGKTRKMQLIQKDDGYDPARTIPLTDELLDSDKVFALTTGGSANVFRVYDKVNQRCVPQPIALTGHPAWGDPVNHPWTVGYQLSYYTEAVLWGTYIEKNTPPGVTVAAIVINNDFGRAYSTGFQAFVAQSKHNINYEFETIEPTAPNITNEMTTLAAKNPDVFIAMTAGTSCTQAITEAAQDGMKGKAKILFQPSVCKSISFVGKEKVGGDGSASDGWVAMGSGAIDILDPAVQDLPQIRFEKEQLAKGGYDPKTSSQFGNGYIYAFPYVEYLRIAAELDGGLNRTNLILAVRASDMVSPFMLPGVTLKLNGNKDAYLVEASDPGRFVAAKQTWEPVGDLINLEGKGGLCAWDISTSKCR
jgi:branched-chain amino acid transport system substrate-binding protein